MQINTPVNASGSGGSAGTGRIRCAVTCPMCRHAHTQVRLNPRLFWCTEMDLDRKPARFHCLKEAEGLYPPLYDLWHCPKCHFTAHNRVFPDPLKDVIIEKGFVQNRLAEALRNRPGFRRISETLGADLPSEEIGMEAALRKALLAIHYQRFLVGLLDRNQAELAQDYLRLAWLYRDGSEKDPDVAETCERMNRLLDSIAADWPDAPRDEAAALQHACDVFRQALETPPASKDPVESTSILLHLARIHLQRGDREGAGMALNEGRRAVMDPMMEATRILREDDQTRRMGKEERERWVTRGRRLRAALDEMEKLQDRRKALA